MGIEYTNKWLPKEEWSREQRLKRDEYMTKQKAETLGLLQRKRDRGELSTEEFEKRRKELGV